MPETSVENQICNACSTNVREGALFCYSCGGQVASQIAVAKNDKNETVVPERFQETIIEENENGAESKQTEVELKPEVKEIYVEETIGKPVIEPSLLEADKLKSAAAMRGKSKLIKPKKVEVVWEEHENAPNVWFILVALVLTILAIVILFLAIRMK